MEDVPTQANIVHVTHNTLHTRLDTTGRGMYPAKRQSRRVEANVADLGFTGNQHCVTLPLP